MTDQKIALRDQARHERSQEFIPCNFSVILKSPEILSASTIASYLSYDLEPSTVEINETILRDGKTLVLPRINGDQLEWVTWNGDRSHLTSKKKISEPIGEALQDLSVIKAVIVPALKFPLASRATMAELVLPEVAVVAELLTFPAVAIVANLVSSIAAVVAMSAFKIVASAILVLVTAPEAMAGEVAEPVKSPAN